MSTLHERLQTRITTELDGCEDTSAQAIVGAARSVVELHKPEFFGGVNACLACSPGMPPPILIDAPCPTIKAIAEALGVEIEETSK